MLGVISDYTQAITGQVTEVTCPVIGRTQPELSASKTQKTGHGVATSVNIAYRDSQLNISGCRNNKIIITIPVGWDHYFRCMIELLCMVSCCRLLGTEVLPVRAQINSWIELEIIINSIQFSMNWIGIELKDFELELNWNWKIELIEIDQVNQSNFNSTPHFTRFNIFLYGTLWKLQRDKQTAYMRLLVADKQSHVSKHTHMLHCVFPVRGLQGSLNMKGWPLNQLLWYISSGLTHYS